MQRVEALEQVGRKFVGFASIEVWPGQTLDQAKAAWEADNGSIGGRQVILWDFGGLKNATA